MFENVPHTENVAALSRDEDLKNGDQEDGKQ